MEKGEAFTSRNEASTPGAVLTWFYHAPSDTKNQPSIGLLLGQGLRRRPSSKPMLVSVSNSRGMLHFQRMPHGKTPMELENFHLNGEIETFRFFVPHLAVLSANRSAF